MLIQTIDERFRVLPTKNRNERIKDRLHAIDYGAKDARDRTTFYIEAGIRPANQK